jgi:hypothetical protein
VSTLGQVVLGERVLAGPLLADRVYERLVQHPATAAEVLRGGWLAVELGRQGVEHIRDH